METRKTQIYLALSTTIILTSIWVLSMYESEAQIENFYKIISILNDKNLTDNQDFKNNKKIPPILEIFSKINFYFKNKFTPEYKPLKQGEVLRSSLDITKAKNNLNWEPIYSLESGMNETYFFFQNQFEKNKDL